MLSLIHISTLLSDGSDAVPLGIFDIRAEGNWTITVSTVTNLSTNSVTSIGDKVSGVFNLPGTGTTVSINNTGISNFIVWAHYYDGTSQLLVNNSGADSGQAVLNLSLIHICIKRVMEMYGDTMDEGRKNIARSDACLLYTSCGG